jgi:hypothetical protein
MGSGGIAPCILNLCTRWRWVFGEREPCTHWIGGWVGPRAGRRFGEEKNHLPLPEKNLGDAYCSRHLYFDPRPEFWCFLFLIQYVHFEICFRTSRSLQFVFTFTSVKLMSWKRSGSVFEWYPIGISAVLSSAVIREATWCSSIYRANARIVHRVQWSRKQGSQHTPYGIFLTDYWTDCL